MNFSSDKPLARLRTREDRISEVLRQIGLRLDVNVEVSCAPLTAGARQFNIFVAEAELDYLGVIGALIEGFPVVLALEDDTFWVFDSFTRNRVDAIFVGDARRPQQLSTRQLRVLLETNVGAVLFLAKRELECDSISSAHPDHHHHDHGHGHGGHGHGGHGHGGHGHGMKPLRRFIGLLKLDQRDVFTIILFASVSGVLALATPLAIESLVNVVSWGTYLQPLLILTLILFSCLGLAGILKVLQALLVETIQRRQFVRLIGDFAHRFPRANREALDGEYARELANRVLDVTTIQKASATLLLEGISIALTTVVGLILLGFYHPFLLGFDIVLIATMTTMTLVLGRGGIRTAVDESRKKYEIAHWLQDVIATPAAFKANGGELLAVEHANRLTTEYIFERRKQFRVVIRQTAFAISLQVIASSALLSLGGWLVITQQLTLGQLVASELVLTLVMGAFAKAGKTLETFYDLMAATDKVGHLLDIPVDPRFESGEMPDGPAEVRWSKISLDSGLQHYELPETRIPAGSRAALCGEDQTRRSLLIKTLAGLIKPHNGIVEVGGLDAQHATMTYAGRLVGYAGLPAVFHASVQENIDLGRSHVGRACVREALVDIGLWDCVLRLPEGLQTELQTDGAPLSGVQVALLAITRAIAGKPNLLLIDGLLDNLPSAAFAQVWSIIAAPDAPWTLIISTNQDHIAQLCTSKVVLN